MWCVDISAKLLLLTAISNIAFSVIPEKTCSCPKGWFGDNCKMQCHCSGTDNVCHKDDGTCDEGCHPDYFGPACQYASMKLTGSFDWLTDRKDGTCNSGNTQTVSASLVTPVPLSRVRVVVNDPERLDGIKLSYRLKSSSTEKDCSNKRRVKVNETSLDIYCPTTEVVTDLTVSGRGVEGLCSLYVSGGRNVALNQRAERSSKYYHWFAGKAVDGKIQQPTVNGHTVAGAQETCSHTSRTYGARSWWAVIFWEPVLIYRFLIYNRMDNNLQSRLKNFLLTVRPSSCEDSVFSHRDNNTEGLDHYTIVPSPRISSLVQDVRITHGSSPFLTICEIYVFGDCPVGKYGFGCTGECSRTCDGPDHACDQFDGTCDSCAPGYTGVKCDQKCSLGKYGKGCTSTCNATCGGPDNLCDISDGRCTAGCDNGFQGLSCDQEMLTAKDDTGLVVGMGITVVGGTIVAILLAWRIQNVSGELSREKELKDPNRSVKFTTLPGGPEGTPMSLIQSQG